MSIVDPHQPYPHLLQSGLHLATQIILYNKILVVKMTAVRTHTMEKRTNPCWMVDGGWKSHGM